MKPDDGCDSGASAERHDGTITGGRPTLFEDRATHTGDAFEETIALCRDAVLSGAGLHHVAHYTVGVCDFSIDVLEDMRFYPVSVDGSAERRDVERRRRDYRRIGSQVAFQASSLDRTLEDSRSGSVIRLVLHAPGGVLFCCPVIPNEYIVALTVEPSARPMAGMPLTGLPGAAAADAATADLVTAWRNCLGLRTQDPGGWPSRRSGEDEGGASETATSLPSQGNPQRIEGADQQSVADLCRAAVGPDDLHYVAHCRDGDVIVVADQLEHRSLSRFFTQISPEGRRKFYTGFCGQLSLLAGQLGRVVRPTISSPIQRIVVDVQQGAIYYYRLRTDEYLVGVTLDQHRIEETDNKMAVLAMQCIAIESDDDDRLTL